MGLGVWGWGCGCLFGFVGYLFGVVGFSLNFVWGVVFCGLYGEFLGFIADGLLDLIVGLLRD